MIKNTNTRIYITISKKQDAWLESFSKNKGITKSKLISWLLAKKTKDVIDTLKLNENPEQEIEKTQEEVSDEEMKEILRRLNEWKNTDVQIH